MRPSDENQSRSKRPNLFSSSHRPAGGNDNILAKLEKHPPAPPDTGAGSRTRLVWLSASGVVIAGLIITLATLAQENAAKPRPLSPAAELAAATTQAAPVLTQASGSGNDAREQAALIVEQAPPPLLTLNKAPNAPAPQASHAQPTGPLKAVQARIDSMLVRVAPRAAARVARVDRVTLVASTVVRKPHPVAPARAEPGIVDTDVALLAVLLAQSRQIAERDQERACAGPKCPTKTGSQQ